jgi:hypothetical protein
MSLRCFLFGHDETLQQQTSRLWLKCETCGRETVGWSLSRTAPIPRGKKILRFQKRLLSGR